MPSFKDRNIIYEDHDNKGVENPNGLIPLNTKNQVKSSFTTCGDCRII